MVGRGIATYLLFQFLIGKLRASTLIFDRKSRDGAVGVSIPHRKAKSKILEVKFLLTIKFQFLIGKLRARSGGSSVSSGLGSSIPHRKAKSQRRYMLDKACLFCFNSS